MEIGGGSNHSLENCPTMAWRGISKRIECLLSVAEISRSMPSFIREWT